MADAALFRNRWFSVVISNTLYALRKTGDVNSGIKMSSPPVL
jgi:hypothetical protein